MHMSSILVQPMETRSSRGCRTVEISTGFVKLKLCKDIRHSYQLELEFPTFSKPLQRMIRRFS